MYSKEGALIDRRELLKIKLKSLADEAKIIRREERKTHGQLRNEMHLHRVGIVRWESRHTHIAYGLIRGKTLDQIEREGSAPYDAAKVEKMVKTYGPTKPVVKPAAVAEAA